VSHVNVAPGVSEWTTDGDVAWCLDDQFVGTVELRRPPDNFFDVPLVRALADACDALSATTCRAIVVCAQGKNFCAGADFTGGSRAASAASGAFSIRTLYDEATRLLRTPIPVIAAVQGAAVGGGLGVACAADFRVGSSTSRFSANFARLGFHQGFGLSVTLPAIVGQQAALDLLYTGRRISGDEAARIGLVDRLAEDVRVGAHEWAQEIAGSAPLAVRSIRETLRGHLADDVSRATDRELAEQDRLRQTSDWAEGVRAVSERRPAQFEGR
jgi:2-(1,2-epoxy-1,2-dihydrophenyl)acetyl-CoA isomerase